MFSPAADRNKSAIFSVLGPRLSRATRLLEIACGSLQHACFIAPQLPHLAWLPTDIDAATIEYGRSLSDRPANVAAPVFLDVHDTEWPISDVDAIYAANLLHISAASVVEALFGGARSVLNQAGTIYLYGPFKRAGAHTSPGNVAFDQDLRARDPSWGIRDVEDVVRAARQAGFAHTDDIDMPANNQMLVFARADSDCEPSLDYS